MHLIPKVFGLVKMGMKLYERGVVTSEYRAQCFKEVSGFILIENINEENRDTGS